MRVTSKGQVTIPQDIREEAGIRPGDDVDFKLEDGEIKLARRNGGQTRVRRAIERLRGTGTVRMTTDEIMALTRG